MEFLKNYIILSNIIFLLVIIFVEKKRPVYALFWISLLVFTSYLGFFSFLFLGLSLKKSRRINKFYGNSALNLYKDHKVETKGDLQRWKKLVDYLEVSGAGKLSTYEEMEVFTTGNHFFSNLINDILKAKQTIHMEYFVFKDDELGRKLFDAMIKKAESGVSIKLLLDGVNSITYKKIKEFEKSGIEVEVFFPSLFHFLKIANLRANYRDHKKLTIIDGRIGYIGGFNIGNEYLGRGRLGKWRDTALRIQGEVIHEIEREFFMSWNFAKKGSKDNMVIPKPLEVNKYKKTTINSTQLVSSGPHFQLRTARDNFLRMIMEAKKTIYIQTPYFIPDDTIMDALKVASISGVNIKIMIPDKPDHFFVYWVNHSFAWELFEYGIGFYRYKEGFIHSKVVIVDDEIATVGTVNFDYRSFYQNFEININLYGGEKIKELRNNFIQDLRVSEKLTNIEYLKRGNLNKFKESLFRLLAPML